MNVSLLKKLSSDGKKQSLFLNWSRPVIHPETGEPTRRQFLKISVFVNPRTPAERYQNKELLALAEMKRAQAQIGITAGDLSFLGAPKSGLSVMGHYDAVSKKARKENTLRGWAFGRNHILSYAGEKMLLSDVDRDFLEGYKAYLLSRLSQNSANTCFAMFRAVLNDAYRSELIARKVTDCSAAIPQAESRREYLTKEEIDTLERTPCSSPVVLRAAMFAAYSGLRFSDVEKLRLRDVAEVPAGLVYVHSQEKTGSREHLPISAKAQAYLDMTLGPDEYQFPGLRALVYAPTSVFRRWADSSGISKRVTFHTMRHTFATGLLSKGVSIEVVSKLLGHKNLSTTAIYAKIIDSRRREAVELL